MLAMPLTQEEAQQRYIHDYYQFRFLLFFNQNNKLELFNI